MIWRKKNRKDRGKNVRKKIVEEKIGKINIIVQVGENKLANNRKMTGKTIWRQKSKYIGGNHHGREKTRERCK